MTKQQRLVLIISIMASFIGALDGFIVNVALPTINKDLGGGLVVQQWVVDAYLLTLGSLILIAGSLSDLFGRKRILTFGLIWFGITSLMCAFSPNGTFLIFSRALQGIAGALLVPSSLAMIISAFSGPAQGKAIGVWTAWFSVAAVTGPLLGGLIISVTTWRWIFAINVFPIALTLWLMRKMESMEEKGGSTKIDWAGAILCAVGLGSTVFALIEQPRYGWSSPLIYLPFTIGIITLILFVWQERYHKDPMLPLSLFRVRNFSVGNLATFFIYGALSMSTFLLIITLQQVCGFTALQAAMSMLPVTVIIFLLSSRFGALAGKFGPRFFMSAGPFVIAIGLLLIARIDTHVNYLSELLPGVLVFGLGLAMMVAPLTSAVLGDIEPRHAGVASAVNNAIARIAGLITIAVVGVITGTQINILGFRRAILVTATLMAIGGIISFLGIRNHVAKTAKPQE